VGRESILVVEDNLELADLIAGKILPSLGYTSQVAYNGKQALSHIQRTPYALILLDLELPDMTGLEILRYLSSNGNPIPAILVTAHGSEQIAAEAFHLGVQDYLTKPFDADQLEKTISRALTETRLRQETARLTSQLQDQVSWMKELFKFGQRITSTLDLSKVLRLIVEAGVQLTQAEEGFLALLDKKSDRLYLRAAKNIEENQIKTMHLLVRDSLVGEVIRSKKPLRGQAYSNNSTIKVSTGYLVQSLLHVPIISNSQAIGVLSVDNRLGNRPFTDRDETLLTSLADYAAVSLENASLYQKAQFEIAERTRVEAALRESQERYALAVEGANDGIWDWNLATNQVYYSPRWKLILGFGEDEIGEKPDEWLDRVHSKDVERVKQNLYAHIQGQAENFRNEHRLQRKDGSYLWVLSRGIAVRGSDGKINRIAGSLTDISLRKSAEARLIHDAFSDRLTGLPNRAFIMDRLQSAITRTQNQEDYLFAVLFLDLDQFKNVNDSLGHPIGDQLLVKIARLLESDLRSNDTVARLGGDEFIILLDDIQDARSAAAFSERLLGKFTTPIRLDIHEVFITTSIGVVLGTVDYRLPEEVLRDADIAMYAAKAKGKANYAMFRPEMRERIQERMALEAELREAISTGQMRVFYQPLLSVQGGQIAGVEALVRWQHPKRGLVSPAEFIELAEETGLVIPMDCWMLEQTCRQVLEWQKLFNPQPPLRLNVNITGELIVQYNLVEVIQEMLRVTGFPGSCLNLEITEGTITENSQTVSEVVSRLREMGIRVYLDDFGTGFSSLSNLQTIPVDGLKIDRSFVEKIPELKQNLEIVQALVELAHALGMEAIAEGVESPEQLEQIKSAHCDFWQGELFSAPVEASRVQSILERAVRKAADPESG
jgi:diguanylate cyclase (GGDEF)-like protein/PAS domain S-box-containing protein